jgi:peptidoglycan/LPS O-acetylase OafA/YrhL
LVVEVSFYVFLPIWAWAMRRVPAKTERERLNVQIVGIVALLAVGFVYQKQFLFTGTGVVPSQVASLALPEFIDQFAIGMALAVASVWLEGKRPPPSIRVVTRYPAVPWIVAGLAFWVASTQIGVHGAFFERPNQTQLLELHYLASVVALGLVLPAVFGNPRAGVLRRFLGAKVLLWVGLVSYAVYLWHVAVLRKLYEWKWPQEVIHDTGLPAFVVWTAMALAIVLAIAAASYYAIERPALSLKRFKPGDWPRGDEQAERLGRWIASLAALVLILSATVDASRAARYGFVGAALVVLFTIGFAPRVDPWRARAAALVMVPGVILFSVAVVRHLAAPGTPSAVGRMAGLWIAFLASLGIMGGGWLLWRSSRPLAGVSGKARRVMQSVSGPRGTNRPPPG